MPNLKVLLDQANQNADTWKGYLETEKDREIYSRNKKFDENDLLKSLENESDDSSDIDLDDCVTEPPKLWPENSND